MLHLGKRIHPAPPATADLTDDPADVPGGVRCGMPRGLWSGLDRLRSRRRTQIHTGRSPQGRLIRHAGALTLSILALAVAMILTPPGGLLMAAVGFPALQPEGFFTTA